MAVTLTEPSIIRFSLLQAPNYKDTCLWLIDDSPSMHRVDPELGISYVHRSLEVAMKMMEQKLVTNPSDRVGILFFNTKETKVPVEGKKISFPGCYAVQPIAQVSVPIVSELKDEIAAAERSENPAEYWKQKFPPDVGQMKTHCALGNAESMLTSAGKTGSRRIFFVTDTDDPYYGRPAKDKLRATAFEKTKEMRRRGIEFQAFFISTPEHRFDTKPYYDTLFQAFEEEAEDNPTLTLLGGNDASTLPLPNWDAHSKWRDVETDYGAKEGGKRVIFRLGMELADGLTIGVAGYNTTIKATKGSAVNVWRKDEDDVWQEVMTENVYECRDTGLTLNVDKDVYHAFSLGFDTSRRGTVRFTPNEIAALKTSGFKPALKVLGFKDRSVLKFWENIKHSVFIFPTDAEYIGSQKAFSALLQVMVGKDKLAIAVYMPRPNSIPEMAALLPTAEVRDETGLQIEPPGMQLIPLPFADDIREMPAEYHRSLSATEEEVAAAGRIVKSFSKAAPFDPDTIQNPALKYHYESLKAVAFGTDIGDPSDDCKPDYEGIEKRAAKFVSAWDALIHGDSRTGDRSHLMQTSRGKAPTIFDGHDEEEALRLHSMEQLEKKVRSRTDVT